jgi:hypothetical protein
MEIVCVTAISGGYDAVIHTHHPNSVDDTKFICFTDNPNLKSSFWEMLPICTEFNGRWDADVRNAKRHKVMIHEYVDCDYSLWIDGNNMLLNSVSYMVKEYLTDCDIATFKHPCRTCIHPEMEICVKLGLDEEDIMRQQVASYEAEGFPRDYGLNAGGFILRRHTEQVKLFNEIWWEEICKHSKRDQLSLNYAIWKSGIKMGLLDDYWSGHLRTMVGHGL